MHAAWRRGGVDQCAGESEQSEVDVGAALVAGAEACEGVQPGQAAFDDLADLAQPGAVRDPAAGDAVSSRTARTISPRPVSSPSVMPRSRSKRRYLSKS
jgi:hypothetical protein